MGERVLVGSHGGMGKVEVVKTFNGPGLSEYDGPCFVVGDFPIA